LENKLSEIQVEELDSDFFKVYSRDNQYYVVMVENELVCTCKGYYFNGRCKHIEKVKEILEMRGKR